MSKTYRADIDGLRAIAVSIIVLFHAGFANLSGGFTGVDVFFVISGYLITSQIASSIEQGNFSFLKFYERRLRRLMPAAMITFLVCAVVAFFILTPEQLSDFGASLFASVFWSSNIFFWQSTGYFDLEAHAKPLLHIWSLSVEEQFYLVWPLLLVVLTRRSRLVSIIGILLISVASLALCQSGLFQPATVFYLMPFRIVEFGIGGALAVVRLKPRNDLQAEASVILGLAIVAVVTVRYNQNTVFPGTAALLPCFGAAAIIFGGQAKCSGWLLRNPLSVWLGRISYSVYLVHWPVIVFYRMMVPGELVGPARYFLLALSIALGWALYVFVETRFRVGVPKQVLVGRKAFLATLAVFALGISLPAAAMRAQGGWEWRYPSEIRDQMKVNLDKNLAWDDLRRLSQPFTTSPYPKVLIVGDSQAGDFLNTILAAHADRGVEIRTYPVQGECQAVIPRTDDYYASLKPPFNDLCKRYHKELLGSGKIEKADTVILASNWQPAGIAELDNTITYYHSKGVKKVFVIGRKDQGLSGQSLLRKFGSLKGIEEKSGKFRSDEAVNINAMLKSQLGPGVYVDLMDLVCPKRGQCRVATPDGKIIFSDIMHYTRPGTDFMASVYASNGIFRVLENPNQAKAGD